MDRAVPFSMMSFTQLYLRPLFFAALLFQPFAVVAQTLPGDLVAAADQCWQFDSAPCFAEVVVALTAPGDLVAASAQCPQFDGAPCLARVGTIRDGAWTALFEEFDFSGGRGVVSSLSLIPGGTLFDRPNSMTVAQDGIVFDWGPWFAGETANFVRDRVGNTYVATEFNPTRLHEVSNQGESQWIEPLIGTTGNFLSLDLAKDQCTLWYSNISASGVFQFDVCNLAQGVQIFGEGARAIRLLPDGGALLALEHRIVRVDEAGNIVDEAPYRVLRRDETLPVFVSFSVSADFGTVWVAEGRMYKEGDLVYQLSLADLGLALSVYRFSTHDAITALAAVPEYRAARASVRRRGVRRPR